MRTSVPLLVATVLLGLVTADLVRRVVAMDRSSPGFIRLTESELEALQTSSAYDLELESFDGTVSTLKMVVRSQGATAIANVTLEEISLGGKLPDEPLPHRVTADGSGVATLRLHFRGVDWTVREPHASGSAPVYEASFAERTTVLFAGSVDAKTSSRGFPVSFGKGPGHADLARLRGRR